MADRPFSLSTTQFIFSMLFGIAIIVLPTTLAKILSPWVGGALLIAFIWKSEQTIEYHKWKKYLLSTMTFLAVIYINLYVNKNDFTSLFSGTEQVTFCDSQAVVTNELRVLSLEFEKTASQYPKLGSANANCITIIPHASLTTYENATVLWMADPSRRSVIVDHERKWFQVDDLNSCNEDWCWDHGVGSSQRTAASAHFKRSPPPHGEFYPLGAMARYISDNPKEWDKLGYVKDYCDLNDRMLFKQEFDNAFVYGIYPETQGDRTGRVFILNKDHSAEIYENGHYDGIECNKRPPY